MRDELIKRRQRLENNSFERFYGDIETSRFRRELDVKKAGN